MVSGTPSVPTLTRGCVFRAEHDDSFVGWRDTTPRKKICVAFNAVPPGLPDEVHYFMATSQVAFYHDNPNLMSDAVEFPAGSYPFFPEQTIVNFREMYSATLAKLRQHSFKPLGSLSPADIKRCEDVARGAMQLLIKHKRLLGLFN